MHKQALPNAILGAATSNPFLLELPISKGDGTVVEEQVVFRPVFPLGTSRLVKTEAPPPLGLILEEWGAGSDPDEPMKAPKGFCVVEAINQGSSAEAAGLQVGDVIRACTAIDMRMEAPTWQVLARN